MDIQPERGLLVVWRIIVWALFCIDGALTACIIMVAGIATREMAAVVAGFLIGVFVLVIHALIHMYFGAFYATIRYKIEEKAVRLWYGVWWRMDKVIPMEKITDVRIFQGPLERAYGISQIHIFTPSTGAMMPEGRMFGVREPEKARDAILANINALREKYPLKAV